MGKSTLNWHANLSSCLHHSHWGNYLTSGGHHEQGYQVRCRPLRGDAPTPIFCNATPDMMQTALRRCAYPLVLFMRYPKIVAIASGAPRTGSCTRGRIWESFGQEVVCRSAHATSEQRYPGVSEFGCRRAGPIPKGWSERNHAT